MNLTRRTALQAIASVGVVKATNALAGPEKNHRVIIVGAGPSGLAAAYELSKAGHNAFVFEARSRPGGRMHTLREPFDDGLYAEAGAAVLIAGNPGLDYAKELGLEMVPISFDPDLGSIAHIRGVRVSEMPGEAPGYPVELGQEDASLSIQQLKTKYYRRPLWEMEGLSRLRNDDYPQEEFLYLDQMPLIEFFRSNGASDAAIELMRLGYFEAYGTGIETASTLQLAREMASFGRGAYQIKGGNDQICAGLASQLPEPVKYSSPVVAIEQTDGEVRVVVENSGERHEVTGDYVIVTAPLQVQFKIAFKPALSDLRNAAIRNVGGGDVCRVYMQTKTRYWEKNGYSGMATTDLPIGSVFHSTANQDGTRGILESFTYEARARHMASLTDAERRQETMDGLSKVYPGIEAQAEKFTSYNWGKDPWALGGHVAFSVGEIGRFQKALREPEGRVYFAGDAIGGIPGYSHAAFQSGIDVATEIDQL